MASLARRRSELEDAELEVMEQLANPLSLFGRAVLEQIKLEARARSDALLAAELDELRELTRREMQRREDDALAVLLLTEALH